MKSVSLSSAMHFFRHLFWDVKRSPILDDVSRQNMKPSFNGRLPSVKRNQRQAAQRKANRRARRLGHA
jgi:hypothetical protein